MEEASQLLESTTKALEVNADEPEEQISENIGILFADDTNLFVCK